MNDKVGEIVKFLRGMEDDAAREAQALGIGVKDIAGNISPFIGTGKYFPHQIIPVNSSQKVINETCQAMVDRGVSKSLAAAKAEWGSYSKYMTSGGRNQDYLKRLVSQGKAKDIESAKQMITEFTAKNSSRKFGSLEFSREIDLPFWDPNPARVLPKFGKGLYNRLEEIKRFGQNDEKFDVLLKQIVKDGGDGKMAKDIYAFWSGKDIFQRDAFGFISPESSQRLRDAQIITKLGLAPISNASQSVLTAIKYGIKNTGQAMGQAFKEGGMDFYNRTAPILDDSIIQIAGGSTGGSSWGAAFLKGIGFNAIEKFNRVVAANAGKNYAQQVTKKLLGNPYDPKLRRALLQMRINPDTVIKHGGLNMDQMITAGKEAVRTTQFTSGVLDLPLFFKSPEGKILTQFKNFAFNHAKFIKEAILQEAARGNYEPMIRAVALMPVVGEGVADLRAVLSGRKRDKKGLERIAENITAVGGFGLFTDLWQSAKYKNLGGFVMGPTFSTAAELFEGMVQLVEGKPKSLTKTVARQAPVAGPLFKNLVK
jgi:hypothetical protein